MVRLCTRFNLSFAIQEVPGNPFIKVEKVTQKISGVALFLPAKYILLLHQDRVGEIRNHCKFIFTKDHGKRLPNGSFDGAIGLVVNGKADGLVRAIDWTYLDPDLVDFSLAVKSELYVTSEYLDVHSSDKQSLSSLYEMFRPLFLFFVECFVLFILSFIFLNVLLHYTYRKGKKQNLLSKTADTFFKFDKPLFKRPNAIGLFLIAFLLLEFLIQNIIQNSISASWVVVDTSQLTTSTEKLLKSKKKVCFIEDGPEVDYFKYAPSNTLPNKIYKQLQFEKYRCFIFKNHAIDFHPYDLDKFLVMMYLDMLRAILGLAQTMNPKNVFVNDKPLFEVVRSVAIRKGLSKEVKNYLDQNAYLLTERGYVQELYYQVNLFVNSRFKSNFRTYYGLEHYLQEYLKIKTLTLDNFEVLFELLFFSQIIALLLYFLGHLYALMVCCLPSKGKLQAPRDYRQKLRLQALVRSPGLRFSFDVPIRGSD